MSPQRVAGAEIKTFDVTAHLMMVAHNVRHPLKIHLHSILTLRMLAHQPIPVTINEILVGTAAGPWLRKLPALKIGNRHIAPCSIHPICKTVDTIRIHTRIKNYNCILQNLLHSLILRSRIKISGNKRRIHTRSLIAMDRMKQIHNNRHL